MTVFAGVPRVERAQLDLDRADRRPRGQVAEVLGPPGRGELAPIVVGEPVQPQRHAVSVLGDRRRDADVAPAVQASSENGPRPIWSRIVTTGGFVIDRRCQFAPSTTSV